MRKITEAKKLLNELLVAKQNRNLDEDYFHELVTRIEKEIASLELVADGHLDFLAESFDDCLDEEYDEPGYAENFKLKKPAAYKKEFKLYIDEWIKNSLQCLDDDLDELDYYLKERREK